MVPGIGPMTGRKLVSAVGSIDALWRQSEHELKTVDGIGPQLLAALGKNPDRPIETVRQQCRQRGIGLLCPDDPDWPALLQRCDDAPLLLFFQGDAGSLSQIRMLAVVGHVGPAGKVA